MVEFNYAFFCLITYWLLLPGCFVGTCRNRLSVYCEFINSLLYSWILHIDHQLIHSPYQASKWILWSTLIEWQKQKQTPHMYTWNLNIGTSLITNDSYNYKREREYIFSQSGGLTVQLLYCIVHIQIYALLTSTSSINNLKLFEWVCFDGLVWFGSVLFNLIRFVCV